MNEVQSQESFLDLGFASQESNYEYTSISRGISYEESEENLLLSINFLVHMETI